MAYCKTCKKQISFFSEWAGSGECKECCLKTFNNSEVRAVSDDPFQRQKFRTVSHAGGQRQEERTQFHSGTDELPEKPVSGLTLIIVSIGLALFSLIIILVGESAGEKAPSVGGMIGLGISGILYLAGVIRWAVSGVYAVHFERLFRQNNEIIDLLEVLADRNDNQKELDLLRRLRNTGQLSNEEYRTQRRQLLRAVKRKE